MLYVTPLATSQMASSSRTRISGILPPYHTLVLGLWFWQKNVFSVDRRLLFSDDNPIGEVLLGTLPSRR